MQESQGRRWRAGWALAAVLTGLSGCRASEPCPCEYVGGTTTSGESASTTVEESESGETMTEGMETTEGSETGSTEAAWECGNFVVEPGEACDEGGEQTASCEANCELPTCGDGIANAQAGEACDEGGEQTATCEANCELPTEEASSVAAARRIAMEVKQ